MRLPRHIQPYGPSALLVQWETRIDDRINKSVHAYARRLRTQTGVAECVPAYASLLVRFAPKTTTAYRLRELIFDLPLPQPAEAKGYRHELPVCYHPDLAPDLENVARTLNISPEQVIDLHTGRDYRVYQLGFCPGFGFLGETDAALNVDRHATPRKSVPAGAVGLAGRQTGIYPTDSPGGWQLIGRCPVPLLQPGDDLTRLRAGDTVRFTPITLDAFHQLTPNDFPWPVR